MNCTEFLATFSSYLDGSASPEEAGVLERHLTECASCSRYRTVVQRGATVLRSLPEPEIREDFEPRLRHRLYHVDDERAIHAQSGAPALTVVGIAILLATLAWVPVLRDGAPVVVLEPIVVDRAPWRPSPIQPVEMTPGGRFSAEQPSDLDEGLWDNAVLYEYSTLSQRYGQGARLRQVGGQDRR